MVLVGEEILWVDLSWNEISSKIGARKPQNPVGQKCFASNELSALGGEPEPDITQIILQLELPLAATCWSDGICAPSPECSNADVAGTYVKMILKGAESCQALIWNVVEILRLSVWAWDITPAFCHLFLINPFSQDWRFLFQQHQLVPPHCPNQLANTQIKVYLLLALESLESPQQPKGQVWTEVVSSEQEFYFQRIQEIIQRKISKGK